MTRTETRLAIKALPYMTASCTDGEWRVAVALTAIASAFPDKSLSWVLRRANAMAYHTHDACDALATAGAMSAQWRAMHAPQFESNAA